MIAFAGAILFAMVVVITILVTCAPLWEFTMGGKYKVLPKHLKIMALLSVIIQLFAIVIILQAGGFVPLWFTEKITKYICIFCSLSVFKYHTEFTIQQ